MQDYKQVIIYNKNCRISFNRCLKYIVLGSVNAVEKSIQTHRDKVEKWLKYGQKKITLQVPHEFELVNLQKTCESKKISTVILTDDKKIPCILVLGPELEKILDPITGALKLF